MAASLTQGSGSAAARVVVVAVSSCAANAAYLALLLVVGDLMNVEPDGGFWYGFLLTAAASAWCLSREKLRSLGAGLLIGGVFAFGLYALFVLWVVLPRTA